MEEKKILKLIDEDGVEKEYEILLAYKWTKTGKNYVVYTDNTHGDDGELNIYAAIYYPDDDGRFEFIESDEEWQEIDKILKRTLYKSGK